MKTLCPRRLPLLILAALLLIWSAPALADKPAEPFTVALVPDTQFYSLKYPERFEAQMRWIKQRAKEDNIRFAIHLGDIVHNNTVKEWEAADKAYKILDGAVPYSVVPGNHDMANVNRQLTRDTSRYNKYFPPSRYQERGWYGGHMGKTNDNNYCLFEGGGMKFMVVSLEFVPTDAALKWAGEVIAKHKDHRVIVATHCYLSSNNQRENRSAQGYRLKGNTGEQMWQKLIRKHANVHLVVCGHIISVGRRTDKNDAGRPVHQILTDYQGLANGGDGWLRTMRFVPAESKIYVKAYSPTLKKHNDDPKHSYSLEYDMTPAKK